MKFINLTVQGFRSIADVQTWSLDSSPGLYYLTGRNEVEPELEANGAGKSSLFEALYWAIYGRTSRGLKAGNVQSWVPKTKKCATLLEFEVNGSVHELYRQWSPNKLLLDEKPIDQETLERHIGIGPESFLQVVYHAQFSPSFLDIPPAERLSLLSEILQLDRWEQASVFAAKTSKELEQQAQSLRERIARQEGELHQLEATNWDEKIRAWEESQAAYIDELNKLIDDTLENHKQALGRLTIAKRQAQNVELIDIAVLEKKVDEATANQTNCHMLTVESKNAIQIVEAQIADLKETETGSVCPVCHQPISKEHVESELLRLTKQRDELFSCSEPAFVAFDQAADLCLAAKNELDTARAENTRRQKATAEVTRKLTQAENDVNNQYRKIEDLTAKREQELRKVSPFAAEAAKAKKEIEKLQVALATNRNDLEDATKLSAAASYWIRGFKELRLFIVEQVLSQLDVEINNALVALGMRDWAVKCSVEAETKSGTVKRGFTVLIKAPHTAEAVPFEVWSGGEAQRLRLAVMLGMSDLISGQTGWVPNIELWDEPSTWMSAAGISDAISLLQARAEARGRSAWLADHRVLDYGGFAGGLIAIKTESGTRFSPLLEESGMEMLSGKIREIPKRRVTRSGKASRAPQEKSASVR